MALGSNDIYSGMNKSFKKGDYCAYCGIYNNPVIKEHVIARAFFRAENLSFQNPIIIPACEKCNTKKSVFETYAAIVFALSSDKELSPKQVKAVWDSQKGKSSLSKIQREKLFNGYHKWIKVNDLYQEKAVVGIDWPAIENLIEYMAMGIVYEYNGKKPVGKLYPNRVVAAMPLETEHDTLVSLKTFDIVEPTHIFRDDGRYDKEIEYAVIFGLDRAIVYLKIFNPLMGCSAAGTQSRYFAVSFQTKF